MYFPENQAASVTRAPTPRPLGALQRVSDLSTRLQEPASPIQQVWVIWRREPQVNGQGVLSGAGAGAGAGRGSWSSLGPFHLDPVPQAGCWPQAACWLQGLQGSGWEMCRGVELKSVWGSSPAASTLQTWPTVKPSGLATGRSKLSPFLPPQAHLPVCQPGQWPLSRSPSGLAGRSWQLQHPSLPHTLSFPEHPWEGPRCSTPTLASTEPLSW